MQAVGEHDRRSDRRDDHAHQAALRLAEFAIAAERGAAEPYSKHEKEETDDFVPENMQRPDDPRHHVVHELADDSRLRFCSHGFCNLILASGRARSGGARPIQWMVPSRMERRVENRLETDGLARHQMIC